MLKKQTKTVIFERAFGVSIDDFHTTKDVNEFIEKVRGEEIRIAKVETPLVEKRGCVFEITKITEYDIDRMVDEAIKTKR